MVDIHFEINGRRVGPNQITDALTKAVLEEAAKQIKQRAGVIRCPTHGHYAKIIAKGRSAENLNFEVSGCCNDLIKKVEQSLK
jgi:hypothetical protein